MAMKMYYYGVGSSDEVEWTAHSTKQLAEELFLAGTLVINGFVPLPLAASPESGVTIPPPALQMCGLREDGTLAEPAEFQKWSKVKIFEKDIEKLENRFSKLDEQSQEEKASPKKRRRLGPGTPPSGAGSSKEEPPAAARISDPPKSRPNVDITALEEGIVKDVPMTGELKGLLIRICANHKIFVMNPIDNSILAKLGATCAGFMKGKWHIPTENSDLDIMFSLKDAHTLVRYEKECKTVGDLVSEVRATKGDAKIRYHKTVDTPTTDGPGFFKLTLHK